MPKGLDSIRKASAEVAARRASRGGGGGRKLTLGDGEEAIIRFLEQDDDIAWAWVHDVPVEGRQWGRPVVCCNQDDDGTPCPGCERNIYRKFKGWINVIWFDAPQFKRDDNNKVVMDGNKPVTEGQKTTTAFFTSGINFFDELEEANTNYRGLRSRRFKLKRKGADKNTKYPFVPVDIDSGPQDFTEEEKELEKGKTDLVPFITPPSYEEFMRELGESGGASSSNGESEQSANPFMRRRSG